MSVLAIVVLLWLTDGLSAGLTSLRFYLFSVGMYGAGVSWVYVSISEFGGAPPLLAGLLVFIFVLSWSLTGLLQGYVYGRFFSFYPLGILAAFPGLWVFSELFRGWVLTGFPWLYLGYSHLETPLIGFAASGGVLAVSFFSAASAALIHESLKARTVHAFVACTLIWLAGYGLGRVDWVHRRDSIDTALIQGDIDQHTKWNRNMVMPIIDRYLSLTEPYWGVDLIVWPEAALTLFRKEAGHLLDALDRKGRENGTALVLGIPDRDGKGRFQNTAIVVGNGDGKYVKRRLVPFGEFVPLEDSLRGLIRFLDLPMSRNVPGPDIQPPLLAGEVVLSMSICYEIVFPSLVRSGRMVPDLLLTISNDTWFGRSIGPAQHMDMARMRAVENGRFLLRATNNGITAVVNHKGEIVDRLPRFQPASLETKVDLMEGRTPFRRFGHVPILVVSALLLAVTVVHGRLFHQGR